MQYNGIYGSEIFYHAFEVTINVQSTAVQLSAFCYRAVKISVNRVKVHEKLWKNNGKQLAASNELPWKAGKSSARQLVAVAVLRTGSVGHLSKSPTPISKFSSKLGKIGPKKMF